MFERTGVGRRPLPGQCIQLVPVWPYVNTLAWQSQQHCLQDCNGVARALRTRLLAVEQLPHLQPQSKKAHGQGLAEVVDLTVRL
ncbi:hypothetical protein D3C86_1624640 [compost metagenome]